MIIIYKCIFCGNRFESLKSTSKTSCPTCGYHKHTEIRELKPQQNNKK